jgi:quinol monooxygenase YgiN
MIDATIKTMVPAEKRKEVLQTIKAILGPIRIERGCISCNCYVDVEDECLFLFREEWETRDDLDNHLRSDHFGILPGSMSLLKAEPDIRFNTIAIYSRGRGDKNGACMTEEKRKFARMFNFIKKTARP